MQVVVDEAVEAGAELCISYCDIQQPLAQRQKQLQRHYHFDCGCERCTAEAAPGGGGKAAAAKMSYSSRGGPKKPPPSKREKRERREERSSSKASSSGGASVSHSVVAVPGAIVHVSVDLRVLLKLTKAPPTSTPTTGTAQHGRKGKAAQPSAPLQEPRCCVFLRCKSVAPSDDALRSVCDEDHSLVDLT